LATGINNSSFARDVFSCSFKVLLAETSWLLVILLILIALKATEIRSSADFVFFIVAFDVSPLGQKGNLQQLGLKNTSVDFLYSSRKYPYLPYDRWTFS